MTLQFMKCTLEEFGEMLRSGEMENLRRDRGLLIECPIREFENHVINVFAPKDHVLWNFDLYPRFWSSEHAFFQKYLTAEIGDEVDKTLARVVKRAGFPVRSSFSLRMMGGWMNRSQFIPKPLRRSDSESMHRHFSVVVPDSRLDAVREHFQLQQKTFLDSAFKRYAEHLPDPSDFDDLIDTNQGFLLTQSPEYLQGESEKKSLLYEEAERLLANQYTLQNFVDGLDPRYGIRGLVRLMGVSKNDLQHVELERFAIVLRFHLSVALRICSFPTLARELFHSINGTGRIYPDGIQEELLRKLCDRLLPFKEIVDFDLESCPMINPMKLQHPKQYIYFKPETELPLALNAMPCKAIIVAPLPLSPNWQSNVSRWLIESGCLHIVVCGVDCHSWVVSIEAANLDAHYWQEIPEAQRVLTTCRSNEALRESFWFAKNCARHPIHELRHTIILHLASTDDQVELENLYDNTWAPVNVREYGEARCGID